ncbi:hypothetical protein AB0368_02425 [Actinoplanes sp. NPDC051475]|uniref:hypothetical protein n=1 Tax=Actinoplanes sp. NPDC051475 TaxID=3157225 RepID=UPI00344DA57E
MSRTVRWFDRLRIERLVWMLDQQLYDLPRQSRLTTRREVRANLLEAASDVGTTEALRRVGGSRGLAEQYLIAEFGEGPRHSWVAAAYVATLIPLLVNYVFAEAQVAFERGLTTVDPHVTGTFVWDGLELVQNAATITVADGRVSSTGGSWTVLMYVLWILATVLAGRLWRLPVFRRRGAGVRADTA